MTPDDYRRLALSFSEVKESSHMDHPDFRMRGKIFATLWKGNGVLLLSREQQDSLIMAETKTFTPVKGAWGKKGSTIVHLELANERSVRKAMSMAWRNKAPKDLS